MKIYTELYDKAIVLFLDTQVTGNRERDTVNIALEFHGERDPDKLLDLLLPALTQLVYHAYGEPLHLQYLKPIESIKETRFDATCVNGVKGCKLK